ncbi:hypothetical protein D9M73_174680 [compost metagenome]
MPLCVEQNLGPSRFTHNLSGTAGPVWAGLPANEGNALALYCLVGHLRGLARPHGRWAGANDCGEVRKGDAGIFAKRHQGTQHIAHLPHVPRPVKCEQRLPRPGLDVYALPLRLLA